MGPICPHCGFDDNEWCTAWDGGAPDYRPGSLCNGCGAFVANDEWEYEDDDLDDIELPGFGASAADVADILDDMPPSEPQDPVIW
jgi:hypothetical protein